MRGLIIAHSHGHCAIDRECASAEVIRFDPVADFVDEEIHDDDSPVITGFETELGDQVYVSMTSFTKDQFAALWEGVRSDVMIAWLHRKDRKHQTTPKDAFFMTLCVLKHCNPWYKHAADFRLQPSSFERMVEKMLLVIEPVLTTLHIIPARGVAAQKFDNFPVALYATDVKFQQSNRPGGTFLDAKKYFSGKHHLYGLKIECPVGPDGRAVNVTHHYAGSLTDATIFMENIDAHRQMLAKTTADGCISDFQEGASRFPGQWAVLVDKGYLGIGAHVRAIHPKETPPKGALSPEDVERNRLVSHDCVIVENFFGRMNMLWRVMYKKYTWSEDRYDLLVRVCVALTNFHISLNPLRAQDREAYRAALAKYLPQAHQREERPRKQHAESLKRREDRLIDSEAVASVSAAAQRTWAPSQSTHQVTRASPSHPYAARGAFRSSPYGTRSRANPSSQHSPRALSYEDSQASQAYKLYECKFLD